MGTKSSNLRARIRIALALAAVAIAAATPTAIGALSHGSSVADGGGSGPCCSGGGP